MAAEAAGQLADPVDRSIRRPSAQFPRETFPLGRRRACRRSLCSSVTLQPSHRSEARLERARGRSRGLFAWPPCGGWPPGAAHRGREGRPGTGGVVTSVGETRVRLIARVKRLSYVKGAKTRIRPDQPSRGPDIWLRPGPDTCFMNIVWRDRTPWLIAGRRRRDPLRVRSGGP